MVMIWGGLVEEGVWGWWFEGGFYSVGEVGWTGWTGSERRLQGGGGREESEGRGRRLVKWS